MVWTADLLPSLVGVGILVLLATCVLWTYRAPHHWAPALAVLRGTSQLALISVILSGVITSLLWVGLALLVMFSVAAGTATHRIGWSYAHARMMISAMATGILVTLGSLHHRRDRVQRAVRAGYRRHRDWQCDDYRNACGAPVHRSHRRPPGGNRGLARTGCYPAPKHV